MTAPITSPSDAPVDEAELEELDELENWTPEDAPETFLVPVSTTVEWRQFGRFLRSPHLPPHPGRSPGKAQATLRMLWLDLPIMGVLIGTLTLLTVFGFEMPENVNSTLEPTLFIFATIVIVAPVLEEIAFRSWLSGRPWLMALVGLLVTGLVGVPVTLSLIDPQGTMPLLNGLAVIFVALAFTAAGMLRNATVPGWYREKFPWYFWGSTIAFALIHLGNYTQLSWATLIIVLPLVLPQFLLGTMLGYLRVHYGLAPAIALHAAHNTILFGLAVLGGLGETPATGA